MVARVRNSFLRTFLAVVLVVASNLGSAVDALCQNLTVKKGAELVLFDASVSISSNAFASTMLPSDIQVASRKGRLMVASRNLRDSSVVEAEESCRSIMIANPGVVCEPNVEFKISATPNDTYWSYQWNLKGIGASLAWETSVGSKEVVVAVIDTGVDYLHPDLAANVSVNEGEIARNGIDDDANGYVDDVYGYDFSDGDGIPLDLNGHGTHVAGTIGARGNDLYGVTGVAWNVSILPVRVLDADGSGTLADVISGIDYATQRGADVLNLSLGAPYGSKLLLRALQRAELSGAVIVVAAGNEASNNDRTPSFPANYQLPSLISVAATDRYDDLAWFSNVGATTVHLAAPGVSILSTLPVEGYAFMSGTSMAAPHVAGVAAVVKSINSSLSGIAVKDIILNSAASIPSLQGKVITGGRLNAAGAVALARQGSSSPGDEDTGGDRLAIDLSQKLLPNGKRSTFRANVYSLTSGLGVEATAVSLVCGQKAVASAVTDSTGLAIFSKIARAKRSMQCYAAVQTSAGTATSNPVVLRKLALR